MGMGLRLKGPVKRKYPAGLLSAFRAIEMSHESPVGAIDV